MMSNDDISFASRYLRNLLDREYLNIEAEQMSKTYMNSKAVSVKVQVAHCKYMLDAIPEMLDEDTQESREKAMRWLADAGGVMRSELRICSVNELRLIFRPSCA